MTWIVSTMREILSHALGFHRYAQDMRPGEVEQLERRARRALTAMDREIRLMTGRARRPDA